MMTAKGGHIDFMFLAPPPLKAHSHGTICSVCDNNYLHAILWNCSQGVMGVDVICNVFKLKWYITITQNDYGTHSSATLHTPLHCTQRKSHRVNIIINVHTIHFLHRKRKETKNAPCERALTRPLHPLLRMTRCCCCFFPQNVASIAGFFFAITRITYALGYYTGGKPAVLPCLMQLFR